MLDPNPSRPEAMRDLVIDRLRADVAALCAAPDRRVGNPGHAAARRYLLQRYVEIGLLPYGERYEMPYTVAGQRFTNLLAVAQASDAREHDAPTSRHDATAREHDAAAPLLIAAHYDTVAHTPGADDNAAAIAVALEVAARLHDRPAARPVVIAQFDAEELPYFHGPAMGSTHFHDVQARTPVHAAIVLDLVGHALPVPGIEDVVFLTGMESDPALEHTITSLPRFAGLQLVTALNRYVGDMSDHHAFRLGKVPYLFLSCGRWEHYHASSDTPERLDWCKAAAMTDLVEALARNVAECTLSGPWEGYDTTPTDLASMRAGLGPLLTRLGIPMQTRADIDRVAATLLQRFAL